MKQIFLTVLLAILFLSCTNESAEPTLLSFYTIDNIASYPLDGGEGRRVISEKARNSGINIDFTKKDIPKKEYHSILEQHLLSGDSAMAFPVYKDQIKKLADMNLIIPLTNYLDRMPHYTKYLDVREINEFIYNDKIYALPNINKPEHHSGSNTNNGWAVRTDWLESINMPLPETIEELEEIIRLFTEGDPDQNGEDDTYGLSLSLNDSMIWTAFGIPLSREFNNWILMNGKYIHTTTHPDVVTALQVLRDWYSKGYINPSSFLENGLTVQSEGRVGISQITAWSVNRLNQRWNKTGKNNRLTIMPPIKGPKGYSGYLNDHTQNTALAISSALTEQELDSLLRFLDWICDDSETGGFYTVTFGLEGVHHRIDRANNKIILLGDNPHEKMFKAGYSNPVRFIRLEDRRSIQSEELLENIGLLNDPANLFNPEQYIETALERHLKRELQNLWEHTMIAIISGEEEISAWYDYVEYFNSRTSEYAVDSE